MRALVSGFFEYLMSSRTSRRQPNWGGKRLVRKQHVGWGEDSLPFPSQSFTLQIVSRDLSVENVGTQSESRHY